jgi:hypothetical protein
MVIKEKFELIYKSDGEVYNVLPISKSTLSAYLVSNQDRNYLMGLVSTFGRIKSHAGKGLVDKYSKAISVTDFPLYPLPGFVTTSGIPGVNLSVLPQKSITDYNHVDIYTLVLYSAVLKNIMGKTEMSADHAISISNMIFSIFMKLFGKGSGLIGSYSNLIPSLRFLISYYVYVSMFGEEQNDALKKRLGTSLYMDPGTLNLDFDFKSIKNLLLAINKNKIIPLSENTFSNKIISTMGMASLPMFEDVSRFYATIVASTVPGNSIFTGYLSKVNTALFQKLNYIALKM